MISDKHTFRVWHPREGGLPSYTETEFFFMAPIDRRTARYQVEKVEGYVIDRIRPKRKRGLAVTKVRPKVQRVSG